MSVLHGPIIVMSPHQHPPDHGPVRNSSRPLGLTRKCFTDAHDDSCVAFKGTGLCMALCGFVFAHRRCAGPRRADASLPTPSGYSVRVKCGCGVVFTRWVTPGDADEDMLRAAVLAFEN